MRVLLLGATGNLGLRCIPALLAHKHTLIVYIRNVEKLHSLVSPAIISQLTAIVKGDATDSAGIKNAIIEHDIEAIIDVAGNQVLPWKEHLLPKIARAVSDAAIEAGRERGRPLRVWVTTGIGSLEYPGSGGFWLKDYGFIKATMSQHEGTRATIAPIALSDLRWSLLCVAMMVPLDSKQGLFEPLRAPRHHNLLVQADVAPGWTHSWVEGIPIVGRYLWMWGSQVWSYTTPYEDVADMLAEDLDSGGDKWVGKKVGYIDKAKVKNV